MTQTEPAQWPFPVHGLASTQLGTKASPGSDAVPEEVVASAETVTAGPGESKQRTEPSVAFTPGQSAPPTFTDAFASLPPSMSSGTPPGVGAELGKKDVTWGPGGA